MADLSGKSLGRYHILEQLGEGGMAIVYKAYDTRLERDVAIKIIRKGAFPADHIERILKRFEREAKALARLSHPNILKIHDYGEHEGSPYLVMEYLPGGTLKQKMGKPMPWQEAIQLLLPIAEALDYAHSQNMIHRDVKPANILLTQRGQPMLTDFGIAKVLDLEETLDLTGTSAAVGTPEYMAPEQATAKYVDHRADIYSLGVVLYEMVTGRKPFIADTPMAVLIKHATESLPRPTQFVPNLPDEVEKILLKALTKKPQDRYADAGALVDAMNSLIIDAHANLNRRQQTDKRLEDSLEAIDKFSTSSHLLPNSDMYQKSNARLSNKTNTVKHLEKPLNQKRILMLWISLGVTLLALTITLVTLLLKGERTAQIIPSPIMPFTQAPLKTDISSATTIIHPVSTISVTSTPILEVGSTMIGKDGMKLLFVPAGEFIMGSNDGWSAQPIHTVYLNGFWIDQTEVTNEQYAACVITGQCAPPSSIESRWRSDYFGNKQFDKYPVIHVDWYMAKAYCEWTERRLPTEAEWEKAARGTDGRSYPWGEGIDCTRANYWGEDNGNRSCVYDSDTAAVGSYESGKSPYGAYDMAGNVVEWVSDWFSESYYQTTSFSNPFGPDLGQRRVYRGGDWSDEDNRVSSAFRLSQDPSKPFGGFRCVREITQ